MIKNIDHNNVIHYGEDALVIKFENYGYEHPVCLKILNNEYPTPQVSKKFESEFYFSTFCSNPFIRRALKKTEVENHAAIVYEYIEGQNVKEVIQQQKISSDQKLKLAFQLATAVAEIHKLNIIHQNLQPENCIVTKGFEKVVIIDFDKAISNNGIITETSPEGFSLNELKYMAPEQTGRIHQAVDHRADLYSLGIILYELFTNALPFDSKDPSELLYAHLARTPVAPQEMNHTISPVVSNIILKLLKKDAGARYQSAAGLKHDLQLCLQYEASYGYILPFVLGEKDFSGQLFNQQKMYGRQKEMDAILSLFQKSKNGEKQILIISGFSGNGKSTLIGELNSQLSEKNCHFIKGKFEQFNNDTPFHAFVQAFTTLTNGILTEEKKESDYWRNRILNAVGTSGKVLTNLIPEIEKLIGPQPQLIQLKGNEDQNRFNYLMNSFLEAVSTADYPLVLCIDDLQWADASSLHLFRLIAENKNLKHLLLIGAHRANDERTDHFIQDLVTDLNKNHIDHSQIFLNNLSKADVDEIVADALNTKQENSKELSALVYSKTKGNAFYVHHFLKSLYDDGLLHFNFDNNTWEWMEEKIRQTNASENVIDFITSQLQKLPAEALNLFKLASCTGTSFDVLTLSKISGLAPDVIEKNLHHPLSEGILISTDKGYKFSHNRIQQVFYNLINEENKAVIHLNIATALTSFYTSADTEHNLFELVNHWNDATKVVNDKETKKEISQLNIRAGRKAKQNAAYTQSLKYYQAAIQLFLNNEGEKEYEQTILVYTEACEVAYLSGSYEMLDHLSEQVIKKSRNLLDVGKVYEILIQKLIAENRLLEAINLGIRILKQLGVVLPMQPGKVQILYELIKTKWILRNTTPEDIQQLPNVSKAEIIISMRLLSEISSAAYFALPNLMPLLLCNIIQLTVKHGLAPQSPFGFMGWGYIQSVYLGKIESGILYGKLALKLVHQIQANELLASTAMSFNVFLVHWKKHLPETIPYLESAFKKGLEIGDYEFTSYLAHNIVYHSFYSGLPLQPLQEKSEYLFRQIDKFRQEITVKRLQIFSQCIYNLIHPTAEPYYLTGETFDELKIVIPDKPENSGYFQNLYLQKMVLALIFNNHEAALEYSVKCEPYNYIVKGSILFSHFFFYQALAILAADRIRTNQRLLRKVRRNLSYLIKYESYCDKTYRQKRLLVEAEYNCVTNNTDKARRLYDDAIKAAMDGGLLQDMAMCYEKAGQFYLGINSKDIGLFYLIKALECYKNWGALAKVEQMKTSYAALIHFGNNANLNGNTEVTNTSLLNADLTSVLKASTALSEELVLQNLLRKLMQVILENAGAQQGFFIINKKGERVIEAKGSADTETEISLPSIPVANSGLLAESIINYVEVTKELIILDNATISPLFANDEFIKSNKPKSILCTPFMNHGKLQGILYLSNDLIYGAFTKDRLQLLNLLTGQIAVSIENALFYDSLEQRVKDRTEDLQIEKKKSDDLLLNILPEEVATELKQTGYAQARRFENVTVMFTDFKNFTIHSENLKPEQLVAELDICFRKFDEIISKYQLEKIKTIGDAYLCVGGLPHPNPPENVVKAALEICNFMKTLKEQREKLNMPCFEIRIGIHSGPVVAGIVGNKKFAYDIWGDTVNTAARMEQCSEPNKVNISYKTFHLVKDHFNCQHRGKINAKNKGLIDMYFVEDAFTPQSKEMNAVF